MTQETATIFLDRLRKLESLEEAMNKKFKRFYLGYNGKSIQYRETFIEITDSDLIEIGMEQERLKNQISQLNDKIRSFEFDKRK